ncbi:hypothetical protein [Paenibacillus apis]|uniref:Uncharacterized protein n=1 Tax=Paenibacillus apis TaxID=1792174 RepID=A0A920CNN7_9BACL|nr:hypothetical protein [Paenibacillus apis]GIO44019.1 hypothetical protein J41TS4_37770 [Paenibacillus apis]
MFEEIQARKLRIALGSASRNATFVLDKLGLTEAFEYIADPGRIAFGKPHVTVRQRKGYAFRTRKRMCVGIHTRPSTIK